MDDFFGTSVLTEATELPQSVPALPVPYLFSIFCMAGDRAICGLYSIGCFGGVAYNAALLLIVELTADFRGGELAIAVEPSPAPPKTCSLS